MIEAIHFVDQQGLIKWRAKGVVAGSLPELAAALGVEGSELQLRPDPEQWEAADRRRRRPSG